MARRNRLAFTLVELLVVITIIAMLVALLVPAVNRSRESGRRTQCMNNQHEISLAMAQYENSVGRLPGYINKMGTAQLVGGTTRPMPLSWATVLLPNLGRQDLWIEWRSLNVTATFVAPRVIQVPQMICPSDTSKKDYTGSLSYVVNCGLQDDYSTIPDPPDGAAYGVFHNLYGYYSSGTGWTTLTSPKVMTSNIRDGASHTLMLSENVQAGVWFAKPFVDVASQATIEQVFEPNLGFVWFTESQGVPTQGGVINRGRDDTSPSDDSSFPWPVNYNYARPSSHHPQGVVVSYCDGRSQFLSDSIAYGTLRHLMTPDSYTALGSTFTGDPELNE